MLNIKFDRTPSKSFFSKINQDAILNWVEINRSKLSEENYVLKADASSRYWFGISETKLAVYYKRFGVNFNIVLYGSETEVGDFYCLPIVAVQDLLVDKTLYSTGKRKRWVGDIHNHCLYIRNSNVKRNICEFYSLPAAQLVPSILNDKNSNDYAIENTRREINIRVKQSVFREKVLENFDYQCCLTGVKEPELLVASHIVPWSKRLETRLSPHNGLCLNLPYFDGH